MMHSVARVVTFVVVQTNPTLHLAGRDARRRGDQKVCAMANSKGEQVSVRLSAEQRLELERIAAEQDRTLSSTIRRIVAKALSNQGAGVAA